MRLADITGRAGIGLIGIVLSSAILSIIYSSAVQGQGMAVYAPSLGAGHTITIASAGNGVALDTGLYGGILNPASYRTNRNELLCEGNLWSAFSQVGGVESPDMRVGIGAIGYLVRAGAGSFALCYLPRNRIQSRSDYRGGEAGVRLAYSELESAYSVSLSESTRIGLALRWIHSEYAVGNSNIRETLFRPSLYEASIGIRRQRGNWSWGIVIESPTMGEITKAVPDVVGRSESSTDFEGAWGSRVGVGKEWVQYSVELDFAVRAASNVSQDSTTLDGQAMIYQTGFSLRRVINRKAKLFTGASLRSGDKRAGHHLLLGIGAEYLVNPDLTLMASAGMMIPNGDSYTGAPLEDLLPYVLRMGILFHGE